MHQDEIDETGSRFEFGANWARFLSVLDEDRIGEAERSLQEMLATDNLQGLRFLDIGSGSGLFSLAARRLGAVVRSFDYDKESVACTSELRKRYFPDDENWQVESGSALDRDFMRGLGEFDVVYSWGVLHHTGRMWLGIEYALGCVAADGGKFYVAIYNDQGWKSRVWWFIKYFYNQLPNLLKTPYVFLVSAVTRLALIVKYTLKLRPMVAIKPIFQDDSARGMSAKYDKADWIGGFPFEFATFELLVDYFESRGFALIAGKENPSLGCHELSFQRSVCAD